MNRWLLRVAGAVIGAALLLLVGHFYSRLGGT
jgi:hypothetical protein